jgi:hypothetical protein
LCGILCEAGGRGEEQDKNGETKHGIPHLSVYWGRGWFGLLRVRRAWAREGIGGIAADEDRTADCLAG